jgi:hypothetical protein
VAGDAAIYCCYSRLSGYAEQIQFFELKFDIANNFKRSKIKWQAPPVGAPRLRLFP